MINITPIESSQYQDFVSSLENASPYHNAAWSKAVSDAYGFTQHNLGFFRDKELIAVLPAVLMRAPFSRQKLCSLPYCDFGGILCKDGEQVSEVENALVNYTKSKRLPLEYRKSNDELQLEPEQLTQGEKVRMIYDLLDDVDAQMASFKPKLRSQIKKAAKNGIESEVVAKPTEKEFAEFYQVFATNMRDLGSPVHSLSWFKEIFNAYGSNAFMVLVRHEGLCVGGGIVIHTHSRAVIPWASTLRSHNKLAPNMLLYWEVLSEVIRRGITRFDFGRSGYNEGTFRFKKQWGASPTLLSWQQVEGDKLVDEQTGEKSKIRDTVEQIWQKMPVGLSSFVGPKIRKYISL